MNDIARYQVVEVSHGYAVKDMKTGAFPSKAYKKLGWAVRHAVKLNDEIKNLRYSA